MLDEPFELVSAVAASCRIEVTLHCEFVEVENNARVPIVALCMLLRGILAIRVSEEVILMRCVRRFRCGLMEGRKGKHEKIACTL